MIESVHDFEITDPHHHLWDLENLYYPWLTDSFKPRVCGDYSAIRKNYLVEDLLNDIGDLQVTKTVHIEAIIDPPLAVEETAWVQGIADRYQDRGIASGIVAQADFSQDTIEETLEGHNEYSNIRGIRDVVHEGWIDPQNPQPTKLQDPRWRESVGLCQKYGLHFELQIYYQQVEEAVELLKTHPDLPIILTHTGCPAGRSEAAIRGWRETMTRLSEWPHLHVKLSGFSMFERDWTADSIRPFIMDTLEWFGIERCMFATNFPVDRTGCSYLEIWSKFFEATTGFSDTQRHLLFSKNANRFYRLS